MEDKDKHCVEKPSGKESTRERFRRVLGFEPVDRLPACEISPYWTRTLERWWEEGLPREKRFQDEVAEHFGLDIINMCSVSPILKQRPELERVDSELTYKKWLEYLYPENPAEKLITIAPGGWPAVDEKRLEKWVERQRGGRGVILFSMEGFFWFPRVLFGIENHLYAFYDHADLMKKINGDLLEFNIRCIDSVFKIFKPDAVVMMEDMSYNKGPMLSKEHFDEFMAPYYRQISCELKSRGVPLFVDSDGNIVDCVQWFLEVGVEGFTPLERQSGIDLLSMREKHPKIKLLGGFDKMVMSSGQEAMRGEFERLLPVMRQGGYIPSVDHQTPPGVSIENYKTYVGLLKEYCEKAGSSNDEKEGRYGV